MNPITPPQPKITRPLRFGPFKRKETPLCDSLMARVRRLLKRHGISQAELARELGISAVAVTEYLGRKRSTPYGEITLRFVAWVERK